MNEDTAVECMKAGAWDYVIKEHVKRLGPAARGAMDGGGIGLHRRQFAIGFQIFLGLFTAVQPEGKIRGREQSLAVQFLFLVRREGGAPFWPRSLSKASACARASGSLSACAAKHAS